MNIWGLPDRTFNAQALQEMSHAQWAILKKHQQRIRVNLLGAALVQLVLLLAIKKYFGPGVIDAVSFMLFSTGLMYCIMLSILNNDMDPISEKHALYKEVLAACALSPEAESHRKNVLLKRDLCRTDLWAMNNMASHETLANQLH